MITKICLKCKQEYTLDNYYKNCLKKDGYDIYCKACKNILNNKSKPIDYDKKRYLKNKNRLNKQTKLWKSQNKLRIKEYNKQYKKIHEKECKIYTKKYRNDNIENVRKQKRTYNHKRRLIDPNYKLYQNIRTCLYGFLRSNKSLHTHEYICCTVEELWNHLERQFRDGMTRENYGTVWHVDHIIPLQGKIVSGLHVVDNLQVIPGSENSRKGNRFYGC